MDNIHAIFQVDLIEAIDAALKAGLDTESTLFFTLGQAFNLFTQTWECKGVDPATVFAEMARTAAKGVIRIGRD